MELEEIAYNSDIRLSLRPIEFTENRSSYAVEWKLWLPLEEGQTERQAFTNKDLYPVANAKYVFDDVTEDGLEQTFNDYVDRLVLITSLWAHNQGYCTTIIEYLHGSLLTNIDAEYREIGSHSFGVFSIVYADCAMRLLKALNESDLSQLSDDLVEKIEFHYMTCGGDLSDI